MYVCMLMVSDVQLYNVLMNGIGLRGSSLDLTLGPGQYLH